jgi:hypothetical protein
VLGRCRGRAGEVSELREPPKRAMCPARVAIPGRRSRCSTAWHPE